MNTDGISSEPRDSAIPKRRICLCLAILTPILFIPLSARLGAQFGDPSKEFGQLIVTAGSYLVGLVLCWSLIIFGLVRGERPRFLAFIAFAMSVTPIYWVH